VARVLARPDPRPQAWKVSGRSPRERSSSWSTRSAAPSRSLRAGEKHSIHSGVIQHDDVIGRPEGTVVTTQMGARLLAVRPTFAEQVTVGGGRRSRSTQGPRRDPGRGGPVSGAHVFEAGTGTGALTMAALRAVGERGSVVSYEAREEFLEAATRAIVETLVRFRPT